MPKLPVSLVLAVFAITIAAEATQADFVMTVTPSSAPNFFGSPSWPGYETNAMISIENGLGDIGDRETDPTAYEAYMEGEFIGVGNLIVSNFPSWRGVADPAAPFDQERGNRLHFGLHIIGDGVTMFRMADLNWVLSSTDDNNMLGFSGSFAGSTFSSFLIGYDWGPDRMKGGGDDILIDSGAADQFIDELVFVGRGNALDASTEPGNTNQDKLDAAASSLGRFDFIGEYFLNDVNGSLLVGGSSFVRVIPEPGTLAVVATLGLGCVLRRRR